MSIEIRTGPARVIASGEVTTFGGQPLTFELPLLPELRYRVELAFATDPALPDVAVGSVPLEDGVRFDLVNFDGTTGRGSARPVLLCEVADELLFLHFRVFHWGKTEDRTVHYTFYLAGKGAVGWTPAA